VETRETALGATGAAQSLEEVTGRIPRRSLARGMPVPRAQLGEALEVARGQSVRVEVRQGATRLEMEGLAEAAGRRGERVVVKNLSSGRRFSARVAGPGLVVAGTNGKEP
jgi:flagella basal body P-ring formation protein FlgA